jgi:hypothetical protein
VKVSLARILDVQQAYHGFAGNLDAWLPALDE